MCSGFRVAMNVLFCSVVEEFELCIIVLDKMNDFEPEMRCGCKARTPQQLHRGSI